MLKEISITEIEDFKVGNAEDAEGGTGCTVLICPKGATAGVDVRGGSPASRETELLHSVNTVQEINAVMLSGGSAFGLEAGDGAMQFLREKDIGFQTGYGKVPIVCGASLFDLAVASNTAFPDKAMGYEACRSAYSQLPPKEGCHGAGTGATVGKIAGPETCMKSGLGIFATQLGQVKVGVVVALNALGDIIDYDNKEIIAGLMTPEKDGFADTVQHLYSDIEHPRDLWKGNTTIACVITNARLTKPQCNKLASIAHNGFAQSIRPVHSTADGDTIFLMASGQVEVGVDALGALITECTARAVNKAARAAEPAYGLKAAVDFK
ncbi:MAG: P1 family peptidase [Eubacteriaceae bacterium]|nr:P1 family peptidase [Eubacteriaceae bacterium]